MKNNYPMKNGSFLGLVIDYEQLINLQASNSEFKRTKDEKLKVKTNTKRVGTNSNRRGGRHD